MDRAPNPGRIGAVHRLKRTRAQLVNRFTVGGDAKGRAAALSYAGDGEPGFAGDPGRDPWA